jgi:hypothetical protein
MVGDRTKAREERTRRLRWLLAELRDNLDHVANYSLAGGRAKVRLVTDAWDVAKGDVVALSPELQGALRKAYAEVWRFNGVVQYDLIKSSPGSGWLDIPIGIMADEAKRAMQHAADR